VLERQVAEVFDLAFRGSRWRAIELQPATVV